MEFNFKRLLFLFKKDLRYLIVPTFLITGLILAIILGLQLLGLLDSQGPVNIDFFSNFLVFAFISLSIIGSISWEEINKRNKRIDYLLLPASSLEKTLSKFISVVIVYPLMVILLFAALVPILQSLANLFYDGTITFNRAIDDKIILLNAGMIVVSFFAYGSIRFNNSSYVKIILWGLAIIGIFALISFLFAIALYPDLRAEVFGYESTLQRNMNVDTGNHWIISLAKKLYYAVPLIFWTMSYYSLKEKEA